MCLKRLRNIEPETELFNRMKKHSEVVKTESERLLTTVKDVLMNPNNPERHEEKTYVVNKFIDLINLIISDARLSAKSPFDLSMVT